jgi:hypothetical protein
VKVLLSVLHFGFLRNFESLVTELADRGHAVLIAADEREELGGQALAERLATHPQVRWTYTPSYENEPWFRVARKLRQGLDYIRFLDDVYDPFPKLRLRAAERAPVLMTRAPWARSARGRRLLARGAGWVERGLPRHAAMDRFLADERPDVALFASVTNPRAPQLDHLRSARAAGIPSGVCVYSWDHLSSKTLIRVEPDRVFVWNETQKREAIELHGIPPDRIVVTGAQVYDQWFARTPTRTREELLAAMGLPADRELLLYVCSALTPDPGEPRFVRQWVEAVRGSSNERVRSAAILIRPHPERRREWQHVHWPELGPVLIAGDNPVSTSAKTDYFDALSHSLAVVGLVTSAFLEAAIAGRPVMTITPPAMQPHQEGMLHFRYLLEVEGGLLTRARTLDEHVAQLNGMTSGPDQWASRQQRFLRAFVRPHGLDAPATPRFADAVEALGGLRTSTPAEAPAWQRAVARAVVRSADRGLLRPWLRDDRERAEERRRNDAVAEHRREHRAKWRQHRRRKLAMRAQWQIKRVRDLVRPAARHD